MSSPAKAATVAFFAFFAVLAVAAIIFLASIAQHVAHLDARSTPGRPATVRLTTVDTSSVHGWITCRQNHPGAQDVCGVAP